jgi:exodeoxyribonuclease VII large subunit
MAMNFFEFREKLSANAEPARAVSTPAPVKTGDVAMSVWQLTGYIDRAIRAGVPPHVLVKGEVSNWKIHRASGNVYFTLKDPRACIDCVMYAGEASLLRFEPADGMELLAGGRVAVYQQRGKYQLYVTTLEPIGQGALELAFRQLCTKLEAEGLFAADRKRPIPPFPMRIALVTSSGTAALQDMLKVLRRFAFLHLRVYHVPVQGSGAAEQIAAAVNHLGRMHKSIGGVDVILLARGGGSLEDRWPFNEESVARAIAGCPIPVITGIGHEVDTSIADLIADHHAHTPTEAAQVATSNWRSARDGVEMSGLRLRRAAAARLSDARQRLASIERHETFRRPRDRINQLRQLLDDRQRALTFFAADHVAGCAKRLAALSANLAERHPRHAVRLAGERVAAMSARMSGAVTGDLKRRLMRLDMMQRHLDAIGPQQVLRRGYTITTAKKGGQVIRTAEQIRPGDKLITRFADGTVESTAADPKQPGLFE